MPKIFKGISLLTIFVYRKEMLAAKSDCVILWLYILQALPFIFQLQTRSELNLCILLYIRVLYFEFFQVIQILLRCLRSLTTKSVCFNGSLHLLLSFMFCSFQQSMTRWPSTQILRELYRITQPWCTPYRDTETSYR